MLRLKTILQYNYIYIILFILVIIISLVRVNIDDKSIFNLNDKKFTGTLLEYKIDGDKLSFIIKNKEKLKCTYYISSEEEKNYLSNLDLGITLSLEGTLKVPSNNTIPNTFNYKKYLNSLDIFYTLSVEKLNVLNNKTSIFYSLKNRLIAYINTFHSKSYLNTFVIGNKNDLGEGVYEAYQDLGVSHIFAISGMHISLLSGIILSLLKKLKANETLSYIFVISFLVFYTFITNYQASILRSVGLFSLLFINKKFKLNIDTVSIVLLDISILLLVNENLLTNVGFIYSSIVSFFLIKFNYLVKGNYLEKLFKVSLIAFLASLPITLYNNYEFNLLSILNNLIIVPFVSVFLYPFSLLTLIFKPLDEILFLITNILEIITHKMFVLNIIIPKINFIFIIIYYVLLICLFKSFNKKYFLLIVLLLIGTKYLNYFDQNYYVYFLDVGQGDSIVIKKGSECIMIDTGGKIEYDVLPWQEKKKYNLSENTIKFLKSIGVYDLDYVILTHGDADHAGEISYLINNFRIKNVIINKDNKNYLEQNIDANLLKDTYSGKLPLNILTNPKIYDNENDNSLITFLSAYNYKIIFMGDASKTVENDLLNLYELDVDLIKLGHHGSKTSSDELFLKTITPEKAIISSGRNNRYHHPNQETLDTLNNLHIDFLNTQDKGTIEIIISKKSVTFRNFSP